MKKILLILSLISVLFLVGCHKNQESISTNNEPVVSSQSQSENENNNDLTNELSQTKQEYSNEYVKLINEIEESTYTDEYSSIKYGLIYFNDDDVPELIVQLPTEWIDIYTCDNGITKPVGGVPTGGSGGYNPEFSPRKSIISLASHGSESYYKEYFEMNDRGELVKTYKVQIDGLNFNTNDEVDLESGTKTETGNLLYSNLDECVFESLGGSLSADDVIAELTK